MRDSDLPFRATIGRATLTEPAGSTVKGRTFTKATGVPVRLSEIRGDRTRVSAGHLDEATHRLLARPATGPSGTIEPGDLLFVESGPSLAGEYFEVGPTSLPDGRILSAVVELDEEEKTKAARGDADALV